MVYPRNDKSVHIHRYNQLGLLSSILLIIGILGSGPLGTFLVFKIAPQESGWSGLEKFAQNFSTIQMLPLLAELLIGFGFVLLMGVLHSQKRSIWTLFGLSFGIIYTSIIGIHDLIQLTVVRFNLINDQLEGLNLWVMCNPWSIPWSLKMLGYGLQGLAILSIFHLFNGSTLNKILRSVFLINGMCGIFASIIYVVYENWLIEPVGFIFYLFWNIGFTVMILLLLNYFHNSLKNELK